ncbi:hypothetical protein BJX66DRAFT_91106 [Aspergillus keveii]|uniref:Uncharacterized protein n=1 Tax=Aspergillus keveii TaxID=714993 RepID=A0ABR4FMB7_9EURO
MPRGRETGRVASVDPNVQPCRHRRSAKWQHDSGGRHPGESTPENLARTRSPQLTKMDSQRSRVQVMSRGGSRQSRRPALPSPVRPLIGPGSGANWGAKRPQPRLFSISSVIPDDHGLLQECVCRSQSWFVSSNKCSAPSLMHWCLGQRSLLLPASQQNCLTATVACQRLV